MEICTYTVDSFADVHEIHTHTVYPLTKNQCSM